MLGPVSEAAEGRKLRVEEEEELRGNNLPKLSKLWTAYSGFCYNTHNPADAEILGAVEERRCLHIRRLATYPGRGVEVMKSWKKALISLVWALILVILMTIKVG